MRVVSVYTFIFFALMAVHGTAYAASATISNPLPAVNVPPGATVSFTITPEGFINPIYQLVDSFPGGASSAYLHGAGFIWTPNYSDIGTHTMTVTVSDSQGSVATAATTVTVEGPPKLEIDSLAPGIYTNVGATVSFVMSPYGMWKPTYSKSDSFPLTSVNSYAILNNAGEFFWTPLAHDVGTHTITIAGIDTYGNEASVEQEIVVLPSTSLSFVNISPDTSVHAESEFSFTATTTGFVNPTFEISDVFYIGTSTISIDTKGNATWVPTPNEVGKHTFTVTVADSDGRTKTATLTVTVLAALPKSNTPAPKPEPQPKTSSAPAPPPPTSGSGRGSPPSYIPPTTPTTPKPKPAPSGGNLVYPSKEKPHPSLLLESNAENIEFTEFEDKRESFKEFIVRSISGLVSSILNFLTRP